MVSHLPLLVSRLAILNISRHTQAYEYFFIMSFLIYRSSEIFPTPAKHSVPDRPQLEHHTGTISQA